MACRIPSHLSRLGLLAVVVILPLTAWSQFPPECTDLKESSRPEMEQQRAALTNEVIRAMSSLPNATAIPDAIKSKQARLLELVFKLDCIRPDARADPLFDTRAADTARNVLVPVFFATNRAANMAQPKRLMFNSEIVKEITWGKAVVSVPTDRSPGDLNVPALWKFELKPDISKHFVLTEVKSLGSSGGFAEAIKQDLSQASSKSLLLFVHGYRVTFDEAAMRTAQLAHDLRFRGISMFYSWPSRGDLLGYWHDEEAVQLSEAGYDFLLETLDTLPFQSIYVLAHSMGNRLVTTVHNERTKAGKDLKAVKEVLLAAPDISAELFNDKIAPLFAMAGQPRTTIYASDGDVALIASKVVHQFRRLGDASPPVYRRSPFETIDASNAAPMRRAAGHSYVFDSPKVITDVQRLLIQGQPADIRPTLQRVQGETPRYWTFK